jgi:hypothetical protein
MKMNTVKVDENVDVVELRRTYWKCVGCERIYTKMNVRDDAVSCIECGSYKMLPVTVFEVFERRKKAEEEP